MTESMKIYILLMLMAVFVRVSYLPIRVEAKPHRGTPPESLAA
jgi:hypothetical protein